MSCRGGRRCFSIDAPAGHASAAMEGSTTNGGLQPRELAREVRPSRREEVSAREDLRSANSWSVTAYVVCADRLADHRIVTATTGSDSSAAKSATATCPSDTQLLGTGYRTDGRGIRVTNVHPGGTIRPTNVAVSAEEEHDGTASNWAVTAFADCATP